MIHRFTISIADRAPIDMAFDLDPARLPTDAALLHYFNHGAIPEPEVGHLMVKVVRPGDVVIDGGANVGFFTVLLSKLVGPDGLVLAVEPSERNRIKLARNLDLNGCTNVTLRPEALSHDNEPVRFYEKPDNGEDGCFGDGEHRMVPAVTLDELTDDRSIRLIKLDIEGYEPNALRGAEHALIWIAPFIVCETNSTIPNSAMVVRNILRAHYFDPFILSESGTIPAFVPDSCRLSPQRMNSNVLFSTMAQVAEAWREVRY